MQHIGHWPDGLLRLYTFINRMQNRQRGPRTTKEWNYLHIALFSTQNRQSKSERMASTPDQAHKAPITLYTTQTPNGIKISIALEELGVPYGVHKHDFVARTQKEPWYLAINPNGRIPAITDTLASGEQIHVWESGSILKYLVERYDPDFKLWFKPGTKENYELFNWVSHALSLLSFLLSLVRRWTTTDL
jgi:hypothetical protein